MAVSVDVSKVSTILLDIEGTTTSISFVKDVLFPYARKEMEIYLKENWNDSNVQSIIKIIQEQSEIDAKEGLLESSIPVGTDKEAMLPNVMGNLMWQMDNDRKTTGLKALQGKIWRSGYESGALKSHIYEDVPQAFERWINSNKKICIYSSGSVEAQILLFEHTTFGDLTKYLSGYFDTTTGPKVEASSYKTISDKIGVVPSDILFATDVSKEAYAAKDAGLQVVVSIRPGNAPLTEQEEQDFPNVPNFNDL